MEELTRKEEQILLAVHLLKDNAYLITIREQIKKYTGKYYSVGTIYAPLNRLNINGYLKSEQKKVPDGNKTKPIKFYSVTDRGYQALAYVKQMNSEMWDGIKHPLLEKQVQK